MKKQKYKKPKYKIGDIVIIRKDHSGNVVISQQIIEIAKLFNDNCEWIYHGKGEIFFENEVIKKVDK
jgi:hypothetical protein